MKIVFEPDAEYISESQKGIKYVNQRLTTKKTVCLDNYEWVEKNSGEFIHLITNGNANAQNSIRVKSKIKNKISY